MHFSSACEKEIGTCRFRVILLNSSLYEKEYKSSDWSHVVFSPNWDRCLFWGKISLIRLIKK